MTEPTAKSDDRVKVFISYSRRDLAFTERLVEGLKARGLAAKIDTRDLPKLEDWRRELLGFIREADAVVFVISPHSIHSNVCSWEIEQVTALNKRLAPIVLERVPDDRIPAAAAKINYVYFDKPDEFEQQADVLAQALQTNLQWLKNHTRLGELAHRWNERGRAGALTLRGQELEEAERWIASHPRGAPEPSELHKSFLAESRRAATRRLRYSVAGALAVGALAIGLAAFALVQQRAAEASRTNAVKVLAASDLQRGTTALQSDETTAEGMAYLARAVRRGQDQRAVTRLWTLLQQRGFWLPTADKAPASLPPSSAAQLAQDNVPPAIKNRFAKFTIKGEVRETQFISMSPDRKLVFTSLGRLDGDVLYRIWRVDGTPVTNWLVPEYKGLQFRPRNQGRVLAGQPLSRARGAALAGDFVIPGLRPAQRQTHRRRGYRRIGSAAAISGCRILPPRIHRRDAGEFRRLGLPDSGRFRQGATRPCSGCRAPARCRWRATGIPIRSCSRRLDPASEWLMSASSDGTVRVSSVREGGEPIGNALQLGIAASSVQRVGSGWARGCARERRAAHLRSASGNAGRAAG